MAEKKIKMAIAQEATGSQPFQPFHLVSRVLKITATEPSASARMCKNIPCMFSLSWECPGTAGGRVGGRDKVVPFADFEECS
jgi:hypothetical protein